MEVTRQFTQIETSTVWPVHCVAIAKLAYKICQTILFRVLFEFEFFGLYSFLVTEIPVTLSKGISKYVLIVEGSTCNRER
jgi:hypothetical protein